MSALSLNLGFMKGGLQSIRTKCVILQLSVIYFTCRLVLGNPDGKVHDYCQWEVFNATCPEGSMLVMNSAQYGRMRLGRCMDTDFYIGCAADVLSLMDSRCSGRPSCLIQLPDNTLHHHQPCPKDLMVYLEASYTCVPVATADSRLCKETGPIRLRSSSDSSATSLTGYLSSYITQAYALGSYNCPWVITVKSGQKISLFLFDFSLGSRYRTSEGQSSSVRGADKSEKPSSHHQNSASKHQKPSGSYSRGQNTEYCHMYASVTEHHPGERMTHGGDMSERWQEPICADSVRERQVYTSQTNSLTVEFVEQIIGDPSVNFLIKYTATGCADMEAPSNAWVTREGDRVIIKCNQTTQTSHLICNGVTWVGNPGNGCPSSDSSQGFNSVDDSIFPTSGLVIAVIIGIFVGSLCGFLLLAFVLWCKRRSILREAPLYQHDVGLVMPPGECEQHHQIYQPHHMQQHHCKIHQLPPAGEYGYTHVWEVRNTQLPIGPCTPVIRRTAPGPAGEGQGDGLGEQGDIEGNLAGQEQGSNLQHVSFGDVQFCPGYGRPGDHPYECPIFDERFLIQYQQQKEGGGHPMFDTMPARAGPPNRPCYPAACPSKPGRFCSHQNINTAQDDTLDRMPVPENGSLDRQLSHPNQNSQIDMQIKDSIAGETRIVEDSGTEGQGKCGVSTFKGQGRTQDIVNCSVPRSPLTTGPALTNKCYH